MEHSEETVIKIETPENKLVKNELSTNEPVQAVITLTDAPTDLLQLAQNEFNRNRKIILKNVDDVTLEVCKIIF
jgi:hypothetical protein